MSITVSIIIPCYNAAKWLARCMDSVLQQSLRDIEIICIDDKSTDDTLEILHKYAKHDNRIKVIELSTNSGVAVARNTGIDAARGEYIGFVDPDDYVDLDFYEKLYTAATQSNADITVGNIREILSDGKKNLFTWWLKTLDNNKLKFNYTLWCAIYKTSFIKNNKIYNPVGVLISEDTVFCVKCAVLANKITTVYDTYYNYVRVPDSLSSRYLSDKKIDSKILAANLILDSLNTTTLGADDWTDAFYPMFEFIYMHCFKHTTKVQAQKQLAHAAIDLFNRAKYQSNIVHKMGYASVFMICNDPDGLYEYIKSIYQVPSPKFIKLFNCITIARIKYYPTYKKISVFGIPVIGIWHKKYN